MHREMLVTEVHLHAYVDGELSPQRRSEVERYLDEHPEARERVHRYQALNDALRRQYEPVLDEPVPDRLLRRATARSVFSRRNVAAAIGWMLLGGAVGAVTQNQLASRQLAVIESDLIRPAAFAHVIYAPEVRHPVEVSADQEAHLVSWLSKRLHTDIRAPSLIEIGYHLVGGRLLPSTNRMAAQFMYENPAGQRVTLYVRTGAWENHATGFHYASEDGVGMFYWVDGALGFAVSGNADKQTLYRVAAVVYRALENPLDTSGNN